MKKSLLQTIHYVTILLVTASATSAYAMGWVHVDPIDENEMRYYDPEGYRRFKQAQAQQYAQYIISIQSIEQETQRRKALPQDRPESLNNVQQPTLQEKQQNDRPEDH
jgi:hypothetical protein